MPLHKFTIGQTVRFLPGAHERAWGGLFQVTALLPSERGDHQYKLKSVRDAHQRVVTESQITIDRQ